ncbi:MAG: hemerythrin domain-containing protein [Candidatus Omnitrophica bacterium]|nr:hemerythrin domain-containing protein [Candidatus Omnitrophota bacterium]
MKEHRLIERMIGVMDFELKKIKKENRADLLFIDEIIDFIKTYADRCHHGKEEDILFKALAKKNISTEHSRIMDELIQEHKMGRSNVKKLSQAKLEYESANTSALRDIISNMETLINFYPKHIEKEDKHFFIPCMDYFTGVEKDTMLRQMREFDAEMIHEKYTAIVSEHEKT